MDSDSDPTSMYSIKGIVILDQDGKRVVSKALQTPKAQHSLEKSLFKKSQRVSNTEVMLFEGITCMYRFNVDLFFYVLGAARENELLIESVLNGFYDAVGIALRKNVEKRTVIDAMDTIILMIDEVCDDGIIMETCPNNIVAQCSLHGDEVSFGSDQSISRIGSSAFNVVREQLKWSLLK